VVISLTIYEPICFNALAREWAYSNPQHILRYCWSCCFEEWSTCSKRGLPHFPLSHLTMNEYPYHQKQFQDTHGCCHYWRSSNRYGATDINDDITWNDDECSKKNMIICWMNIKQWFHSFCYWNVWVSSFSFWFNFDCLCTYHYHTSLMIFFTPLDACFLLSTTHVHNHTMFANHNNFSASYYTWLKSTHHNYCTFDIGQFMANNNSFVLSVLYYC
jgi:hypothetical protein